MLRIRQPDGDKRWWMVERDLTVIFPNALSSTFHALGDMIYKDANKPINFLVQICEQSGDDLYEQIKRVVKFYAEFIKTAGSKNPPYDVWDLYCNNRTSAADVVDMAITITLLHKFAETYTLSLNKHSEDPNLPTIRRLLRQLHHVKASASIEHTAANTEELFPFEATTTRVHPARDISVFVPKIVGTVIDRLQKQMLSSNNFLSTPDKLSQLATLAASLEPLCFDIANRVQNSTAVDMFTNTNSQLQLEFCAAFVDLFVRSYLDCWSSLVISPAATSALDIDCDKFVRILKGHE